MRILVTGGTGTLGRAFVKIARENGNEVFVLTRKKQNPSDIITYIQGDLLTGYGLKEAVNGVDIILHAATSPMKKTKEIDINGTKLLLQEAELAKVKHVIYPSIVGIEHLPMTYYRYKLMAEKIIQQNNIPWSILRATQFHSLIDSIFKRIVKFPIMLIPKQFKCQSVDANEVAQRLFRCVVDGPSGRIPDFAGPKIQTIEEMTQSWLRAKNQNRITFNLPLIGKLSKSLKEGNNTNPSQSLGKASWEDWLIEEANYKQLT